MQRSGFKKFKIALKTKLTGQHTSSGQNTPVCWPHPCYLCDRLQHKGKHVPQASKMGAEQGRAAARGMAFPSWDTYALYITWPRQAFPGKGAPMGLAYLDQQAGAHHYGQGCRDGLKNLIASWMASTPRPSAVSFSWKIF